MCVLASGLGGKTNTIIHRRKFYLVYNFSLIINHSLDHGTQIPYIRKARELGYEVLILNTNNDEYNGKPIRGYRSPTEHGRLVWEQLLLTATQPEYVAVVGHSYGGVVTLDLARRYTKFFKNRVFAVGLTDSVHSTSGTSEEARKHLREVIYLKKLL